MGKRVFIFLLLFVTFIPAMAAKYTPKRFTNMNTGDGLYPYSLNNRQTPNATSGSSPATGGTRKVIKRTNTLARAATTGANNSSVARSVVPRSNIGRGITNTNSTRNISNRGVVARGAKLTNNARTVATTKRTVTVNSNNDTSLPSAQKCFANYKECMEMYCNREETAYNRCYCSAKLAQIDSKYKETIDKKIQEIIILKNSSFADDPNDPLTSVEKYWNDTVSTYTRTNPWLNINDNLAKVTSNLNWADTETRVRGQNAFNIGHEYCANYLRSCSYMASNLRNAYKSEIARDCETYEDTLKRINTVADSVIENYKK